MSRIGQMPVTIPSGVQVNNKDNVLTVKGPKGSLNFDLPQKIKISIDASTLLVERENEEREVRSLHGMCRNHIANMVKGVSEGFSRDLEINGVGYRAES